MTELVAHANISNGLCGQVILIFSIRVIICLFLQRRQRNELTNSYNSQKEFKMTTMLVTVTCLFIILRFPDMIMSQILFVDPEIQIKMGSWSTFFILLTIINHSINFFIYFIFLESFRKTFVKFFLNMFCLSERTEITREPQVECFPQRSPQNTSGNSLFTVDMRNESV